MSVKLALPVALIAVLSLSACNDDEPATGSDNSPETSSSAPTSSAPTETESSAPAETGSADGAEPGSRLDADYTAPGTELAIGESAVIPLTYGTEGQAALEVTVTGIEEGSSADLEAAEVDNAADYTPFYVTVDLEILEVGPNGFGSYQAGADWDGLVGETKAGSLISFGEFAPCPSGGFEFDAAAGDTASSCFTALATKGSEVDGVQWVGDSAAPEYSPLEDGQPIVWR